MITNAKISIVDDDQLGRESLADLLETMGFDVEAFESAEVFLSSARVADTDCLITDMRMNGLSGIDLHKRLVAFGHDMRTIVVTAFPMDSDRIRAKQAGIICYLAKPYDKDHLLACIGATLAGDRRRE